MKKSRLVDKTKRLSCRPRTPREGRPPRERNGPRKTNIPRTDEKVKPAGQFSRPQPVKAGVQHRPKGAWP